MRGIEQRTGLQTDNVGRYNRIFRIGKGFAFGSLHRGIDFLNRYFARQDRNQFGQRAGGDGYALRRAVEFACQLRNHQADGFGRTGGIRHNVQSGGAGASEIVFPMRRVQSILVAGVGMNGGHKTLNHAEFTLQYVGHRRQTVGGAGSGGNHFFAAVQNLMVHAENDGFDIIAARGGNHYLLRARPDMGLRFFFFGKKSGAFQNHVYAEFAPRQFFGIWIGKYFDFFAVYRDISVFQFRFSAKPALCAVVFEQVQQHVCRCQVIDCRYFDVRCFTDKAQSQSADASETVDCHFDSHVSLLVFNILM